MSLAKSKPFRYFAGGLLVIWLLLLTGFLLTREAPTYLEEVRVEPAVAQQQDAKYDAILAELERLREQVGREEAQTATLSQPVLPAQQPVQPVERAVQPPQQPAGPTPVATVPHVPLPSRVPEAVPLPSVSPLHQPVAAVEPTRQATVAKRDIMQDAHLGTVQEGVVELVAELDRLLHPHTERERTYAIEELGVSEKEGRSAYVHDLDLSRERWRGLEEHFTLHGPDSAGARTSTSCAGPVNPYSKEEVMPFSVLVMGSGSGYLSMKLAHTFPRAIVLSMERNETLMYYHRRNIERTATLNNVVVASRLDVDAVETLAASSVFFRFAIVTDIVPLMDGLLPHELEAPMGKLLQLAQTTFVFTPNQSDVHSMHGRFFDYWHNFEGFLMKAADSTGMNGARVTPVAPGIKRVDIATLSRDAEGRPFEKCVRQSGGDCERSDSFMLRFQAPMNNDPSTKFGISSGADMTCSGVPVDILLELDIFPEFMARIFSGLAFLSMPAVHALAPLPLAASTHLTHQGVELVASFNADLVLHDSFGSVFQESPRHAAVHEPAPQPSKNPWMPAQKAGGQAGPPQPLPSLVPAPLPSRVPPPLPSVRREKEVDDELSFLDDDFDLPSDSYWGATESQANWAADDDELLPLAEEEEEEQVWRRSTWDELRYDDDDFAAGGREDEAVARYIRELVDQYQDDADEEDLHDAFPFDSMPEAAPGRRLLATGRAGFISSPSPTPVPLAERTIVEVTPGAPHLDRLLERAVESFEREWDVLKGVVATLPNKRGSWLVSRSGVSLLAGKLARKFPTATVVTIDPAEESVDHQVDLAEMLRLPNVLVAEGSLADPATVDALLASTTVFRYHVLDVETLFAPLFLPSQASLCDRFGDLLALAGTTFVVVPADFTTAAALQLFGRPASHGAADLASIAAECAWRAGADVEVVELPGPDSRSTLLRVDALSLTRELALAHDLPYRTPVTLRYSAEWNGAASLVATSEAGETDCTAFGLEMVDIASLVALGLDQEYRGALAMHYLQAPLREDMHPAFLFWPALDKPLSYCNPESGERELIMRESAEEAHYYELGRLLVEEIAAPEFTFLHLNSGRGDLSKWIAWMRPDSTVVSIEGDEELFYAHHRDAEEEILYNNLVCNSVVDAELMELIGRSPEFFEYGMVSGALAQVRRHGFGWAKDVLSGAMRLSRATFVELPTPAMLSLAHSTVFPERLPPGRALSYRAASHPLPLWANSSHRLLGAFIDAEGLDEVAISVVPYPTPAGREVVRVDVVDMQRQVRHHFLLPRHEFKETHSRTYMLHHHAVGYGDAVGPEVEGMLPPSPPFERVQAPTYLVRDDGSPIIYDEFGITLVAALRLGVHADTKERLYHEFMRIGMREDMAPWNIQFKAGQLHYVDKDSGHFDFEAHLPHVYQVLLAMINFKSTVQEFNHCGQNTKLKYDVAVINFCVGANDVPACDDLAHAVPCADGNCYSTFVGCLRALSELEESLQQELLYQAVMGGAGGDEDEAETAVGVWANGAVQQAAQRKTRLTFL